MNINPAFEEFLKNHPRVADYYHKSITAFEATPEARAETLEELSVALEELSVAQEELIQQNQELQLTRSSVEAERQRYRELFEMAPDGYLVTDGAGVIRQANRAAAKLLNIAQDLLLGKPLSVFVPSQERFKFRWQLNERLQGNANTGEWELQFVPRRGPTFPAAVTVATLNSESGQNGQWLWSIRDISAAKHREAERRQAESSLRRAKLAEATNQILNEEIEERQRLEVALRQSEQRFRHIFHSVGVSIWEEDFTEVKVALDRLKAQGVEDLRQYCTEHPEFVSEMAGRVRLLDVNQLTVQMFEASSKERILKSLNNIFLPETSEIFIEELVALAAGEDFLVGETVVQTLTGRPINVLLTLTFSSLPTAYDRTIVTLLDISDRKQSEFQLHQKADELEELNTILTQTMHLLTERNQELDRFVYIVSHDLKAPLRGIANLAKWLSEDLSGQLPDENLQQLELLQQRVYRMEDLIDALLVYSRVGRLEAAIQTVDVGKLLDEIIDTLSPPATFTIEVMSDLPTIEAKRLLLSQVFSNVIGNAIKHHDRPNGRIVISSAILGDRCEFIVADDGPGIALENHQRVFDIFQTLKADNSRENTGIGLAIVKKIIETEGGEIWVVSQKGEGAAFHFTWPL